MPPVISKLKRKKLQSQNMEVINNVLTFMEKEVVQGSLTIPIKQAQLRAEKTQVYSVVYSESNEKVGCLNPVKAPLFKPQTKKENGRELFQI
jgi:hypothetical protein